VNAHQFNNEPFRILVASLGSGLGATDAFLVSTLSKHMLRELRSSDAALKNPDSLRWNPATKRYGAGTKADDDDEQDAADTIQAGRSKDAGDVSPSVPQPRLPTKENPVIVAVYGQICLAAKSYQSALCEWSISESLDFCAFLNLQNC
jgi:general transcription factor 3C polypeptide 3 (transcription factor C subunit 4)